MQDPDRPGVAHRAQAAVVHDLLQSVQSHPQQIQGQIDRRHFLLERTFDHQDFSRADARLALSIRGCSHLPWVSPDRRSPDPGIPALLSGLLSDERPEFIDSLDMG